VKQQKEVYSAEWCMPKTYNIIPNIKELNKKSFEEEAEFPAKFRVNSDGVIDSVQIEKTHIDYLSGSRYVSVSTPIIWIDKWLEESEYEIEKAIERFTYEYIYKSYLSSKYSSWDRAPFSFANYKNSDENYLEEIWNKAEELVQKYQDTEYKVVIDMDGYSRRNRLYEDKKGTFKYMDAEITLKAIKEDKERQDWNLHLFMNRRTTKRIKNDNFQELEFIEKTLQKNINNIFNSYFYKRYFKPVDVNIINSNTGSSYFQSWSNSINLKKWASDITVLHELAHQGRGCSNDHDRYFTSQLLMLVGRFLGHKEQIKLIEYYRYNNVEWDGIFFHSEKCLEDLGITDEVLLRQNKGNKQCATGDTRMTAKFSNHLTQKVAMRRR